MAIYITVLSTLTSTYSSISRDIFEGNETLRQNAYSKLLSKLSVPEIAHKP